MKEEQNVAATFIVNKDGEDRRICSQCGVEGKPERGAKDFRFFLRGGYRVCTTCWEQRHVIPDPQPKFFRRRRAA